MNIRSSTKQVTFTHPFTLPGYVDLLPAGHYDVFIDEELLQGLSFDAWRRTSTHMMVKGPGGRAEMRPVTEKDLEGVISRDQAALQPKGTTE